MCCGLLLLVTFSVCCLGDLVWIMWLGLALCLGLSGLGCLLVYCLLLVLALLLVLMWFCLGFVGSCFVGCCGCCGFCVITVLLLLLGFGGF